jgi:ABC-type transport system substrate-binding protein
MGCRTVVVAGVGSAVASAMTPSSDTTARHSGDAGTFESTPTKIATAAIEAVEVVDPTTIRLKLKSPSPTLFMNLSAEADNVGGMMSPTGAEKAGDFGMGTLLSGVRPDPDLVLGYRFAKDGPGNYMGVDHPELEKLFADGRTTDDAAKRQEIYEKAQNIIADESYLCFIWRRQGVIAMQKSLQGYTPPWTQAITMSTEFWLDR